jgi:mannose-6-phosphate isomerase-like protein (cupin superfamily)
MVMRSGVTRFIWGVVAGAGLMALVDSGVGLLARDAAAAPAATSGAKYTSKVVLENARVRVKDVTFPPGVTDTGMHTHELAHVGVILTPGALVFMEPGKPAETVKFEVGSVGYREANVTHQATNPGATPMRVIEVELK